MGRRVVVTGIGLICAVGNKTEEVWQQLLKGKSGIGPITQFDASKHACRIAADAVSHRTLVELESGLVHHHKAAVAEENIARVIGLECRGQTLRRVLVNHYCNAWSLLPWSIKEGETAATADRRCIVPVAGIDPYAWKGYDPAPRNVWLRPCKASEERKSQAVVAR